MSYNVEKNIPEEQPPEEPTRLTEWLARMMILINGALDNTDIATITGQLPASPTNGMTKYFNVAIPPDILYPGPWMYIDGEWISLNKKIAVTMIGNHIPDQIPLGIDQPMQIKFGDPQVSSDGVVSIDIDGTVTFLKDATIQATLVLHYTRDSQNNDVYLIFASTFNGNASTNSIIRSLANAMQPEGFEVAFEFSGVAGDEVKFVMVRDSAGTNDGYLHTFDTTQPTYPSGHGASIRITREI